VAHACEVSERRVSEALGVDRSSVRYRSRRFGYRRLHLLLTREDHHMNHKRFRRLYQEEKLQVRRRGGRKRALGVRAPLALPSGPNQRWSLDFASDCLTRRRSWTDFTRESLALNASLCWLSPVVAIETAHHCGYHETLWVQESAGCKCCVREASGPQWPLATFGHNREQAAFKVALATS
jgi:hypothetical protein